MTYTLKTNIGDGIFEEIMVTESELRATLAENLWNSDEPYDFDDAKAHVAQLPISEVVKELKQFDSEVI